MSKFICGDLKGMESYVPGEQPRGKKYIKLNTNESPYPVPEAVINAATEQAGLLNLYSDPVATDLSAALAKYHNVAANNILATNGSDEILAFIMYAFCRGKTVMFPDVTYGFYSSLCKLYNVKCEEVPLNADFTVDFDGYKNADVVFLANPNAQTGVSVESGRLAEFIREKSDRLVLVDEAYVDFGGQTAAPLITECSNLIVVRTFSKSRSLAGGRLGYALASPELISELTSVKFSFNPYSVNRMTLAAGAAAIGCQDYFDGCAKKIIATREYVSSELKKAGFEVVPSSANFVLAKHPKAGGAELKAKLMDKGILVRHFNDKRINDYIRVTVGAVSEMEIFLDAVRLIIGEII